MATRLRSAFHAVNLDCFRAFKPYPCDSIIKKHAQDNWASPNKRVLPQRLLLANVEFHSTCETRQSPSQLSGANLALLRRPKISTVAGATKYVAGKKYAITWSTFITLAPFLRIISEFSGRSKPNSAPKSVQGATPRKTGDRCYGPRRSSMPQVP